MRRHNLWFINRAVNLGDSLEGDIFGHWESVTFLQQNGRMSENVGPDRSYGLMSDIVGFRTLLDVRFCFD